MATSQKGERITIDTVQLRLTAKQGGSSLASVYFKKGRLWLVAPIF
jgi:hypothetical protein